MDLSLTIAPMAEEEEPICHCVDGLRVSGVVSILGSEKGHLMSLRMANAV